VLTNRPAERPSALRLAAQIGAAIALSVLTLSSVFAGTVVDLNCVGARSSFNCAAQWGTAGDPYLRAVPEALGEAEKAQIAERDRKWLARCHPVIEHDRYGVARYRYSAPGCEFGIGAD
jgi:hypothetical protein